MTKPSKESPLDFLSRRRRRPAHVCNSCMYCAPVGCQPGGPDQPEVDPEAFECRYHPPASEGPRRPRVELLEWCRHHPGNQALESYRANKHSALLSGDDS